MYFESQRYRCVYFVTYTSYSLYSSFSIKAASCRLRITMRGICQACKVKASVIRIASHHIAQEGRILGFLFSPEWGRCMMIYKPRAFGNERGVVLLEVSRNVACFLRVVLDKKLIMKLKQFRLPGSLNPAEGRRQEGYYI